MKQIFLLVLITLSMSLSAQKSKKETSGGGTDSKHYDLLMYYMDADYDKCIKKSTKVIEDEETSKEPMPYLYASMCFYEIAFIEEYKESYPDAFKEALKHAVKYRKKDEKSSQKQGLPGLEYWEENKPYFEKLRKSAKEIAENHIDEGKPSKAEYYYKMIVTFDPQDYSAWFMMGQVLLKQGDAINAEKNFLEYENVIKTVSDFKSEPEDKVNLLKYGYMDYANLQIQQGRTDQAKAAIERVTSMVGKDKDIEAFIKDKKLL